MKPAFKTTPMRSRNMSAIRSVDTKLETVFRKALWAKGIRGYRKYPPLKGKPDIFFPRAKLAIFIDGCFWHGCNKHYSPPKNNADYWATKISNNIKRDQQHTKALRAMGYKVLRIWEHEIKVDIDKAIEKVIKKLV